MKLTLALTVYNRYQMLLESFAGVIDDQRIDEVLIMDDASEPEYWNKIKELPKFNPKIKVVRQLENRGMSVNKRDAVFNSANEWVILFDSDNIIGKDYLDALEHANPPLQFTKDNDMKWSNTIYCPSFAKPNFDYQKLSGESVFKNSVINIFNESHPHELWLMMNTCNYVVNKTSYLSIWSENKDMKGSDTVWFNYLWLKAGCLLYIVPHMHYEHRVHPGSGFMQDVDYNMKQAEKIKQMILAL